MEKEEKTEKELYTGLIHTLRAAQGQMDEYASQIPPFTTGQVHALVGEYRLSQFQLRRRCDSYLLAFCLSLLALAASVLWHTAPAGITPLNVAVVIMSVAVATAALRAACSLWLMRRSRRLRSYPYRMAHNADRLARLSRRRRLWIGFVLRNASDTATDRGCRRSELVSLRIPSYSIAACLLLFIAINSDKAFAATRNHAKVTTTTEKTDTAICGTVNNIMAML